MKIGGEAWPPPALPQLHHPQICIICTSLALSLLYDPASCKKTDQAICKYVLACSGTLWCTLVHCSDYSLFSLLQIPVFSSIDYKFLQIPAGV